MKTSPTIGDLAKAMAAVQGDSKNPAKNANNPAFKSRYVNLDEVTSTLRPLWAANGLTVVQLPGICDGGQATLTTLVAHTSGEWLEETATAPLTKADAQGVGSVTTYLRRYALMGLFGLAPDDDDGNAGSLPAASQQAPSLKAPLPPRRDDARPQASDALPLGPTITLADGVVIPDHTVPMGQGKPQGPMSQLSDPKQCRSLASWFNQKADEDEEAGNVRYVAEKRTKADDLRRYADWLENREGNLRQAGLAIGDAMGIADLRPEELPF